MRFIDDQRVIAAQQPVVLCLGQQDAVGHQLDQRARLGAILKTHLIADRFAQRLSQFAGDARRNRACSDASRLCVADGTFNAATCLKAYLG